MPEIAEFGETMTRGSRHAEDTGSADAADQGRGAALVDSLVDRPVLVFGSLPPAGRDLDLLARAPEHDALAAGLEQAGFLRRRHVWARFERCSADVVELVAATDWRLPARELEALFDLARPLEGRRHLVRPAPEHLLLIFARRLARERGPLQAKHRERVAAALGEDPEAWQRARTRAPAWRAPEQVSRLQQRFEEHDPLGGAKLGRGSRSAASAARRLARRRQRMLISLSGLDGCGKSSQSRHLQEALDRAGLETVVVWTSVMSQPEAVAAVKRAANRVLAVAAALRGPKAGPANGAGSAEPVDRANALRHRSASVRFGWALLQGATNAVRQRRATAAELRRGRVVICDRYVLDALVQLRYAYGTGRGTRPLDALLRVIPPRPQLSYLLDVPPEIATARKPEYDVDQNTERAQIYRKLAHEHGAIWIDSTLPPEEICAQIARDVWQLAS